MTDFKRVRAVNGPKHEFDAPVSAIEADPGEYEVLDDTSVTEPREPLYIPLDGLAKKAEQSKGTKTSVGDPEREGDA